jgi:hypothetical protein
MEKVQVPLHQLVLPLSPPSFLLLERQRGELFFNNAHVPHRACLLHRIYQSGGERLIVDLRNGLLLTWFLFRQHFLTPLLAQVLKGDLFEP